MRSHAANVSLYLETIPADRRESLRHLRSLCKKLLVGYEEAMEYGMPSYKRNGRVEVSFASQKNSINLYILNQEAMAKHRARLTGLSLGKGCIRYLKPERMDFAVIADLLRATASSSAGPC